MQHPQMICTTCAKGGGHDVRDNIKHKIGGEHVVCNSNNGELTTGKKQGGMASANDTHNVRNQGGPEVCKGDFTSATLTTVS